LPRIIWVHWATTYCTRLQLCLRRQRPRRMTGRQWEVHVGCHEVCDCHPLFHWLTSFHLAQNPVPAMIKKTWPHARHCHASTTMTHQQPTTHQQPMQRVHMTQTWETMLCGASFISSFSVLALLMDADTMHWWPAWCVNGPHDTSMMATWHIDDNPHNVSTTAHMLRWWQPTPHVDNTHMMCRWPTPCVDTPHHALTAHSSQHPSIHISQSFNPTPSKELIVTCNCKMWVGPSQPIMIKFCYRAWAHYNRILYIADGPV
jgi:hypothetical protein